MAIMKSCCFFKNVWNGSYACAIYTMVYFAFSSLVLLIYIVDEWDYLIGRRRKPIGETIIEKGDVTKTHVIFNIIVLTCSMGLVVSSIILLYGLKKDKREYLLPWILLMISDVLAELLYAIYFLFSKRANFDPIVGFIFTIDLFIVCLNTYCLVCVVSQYQEYKEITNRRNQQQANFMVATEAPENYLSESLALKTMKPVFQNTSLKLNQSTHFLLTSNHCILVIPEEDGATESQL